MSFSVWMSCFKHGENEYFPRTLIDEVFAPYVANRVKDNLCVRFSAGGAAKIFTETEPDVSGLAVNRPPDSPEFWESLMELLRRTPSSLYWPGGGISAVVANPDVIKELPASFIEAVGIQKVVSTGSEIYKCVWSR